MSRRVSAILHSTAPREAARIDLALIRAGYLIAALVSLLPAVFLERRWVGIGPGMLQLHYALSQFVALLLAVRLAGDSVADVRSGFLDLLFLSGTRPAQWLAVRLVQMWVGFASVWIVRAPVLAVIFTLGGITTETLLVMELLLLTTFLILSSVALGASLKARSRHQVFGVAMVAILAVELFLQAPRLFARMFARYQSWSIPLETERLLDEIARMGVAARGLQALSGRLVLSAVWPSFALYGLLAAVVLLRFWRQVAICSQGTTPVSFVEAPDTARHDGRLRRASRRCWDDALAWQAYCVHGRGDWVVRTKCIVYTGLFLGFVVLWIYGVAEIAGMLSLATAAILLIVAVAKPSDCLARELREQTLPMLVLTPRDLDDFYSGWQRGARRLAWPDLVLAMAVTIGSTALHPNVPVVMTAVIAGILCSGPFLMLSPLVPYKSIGTGLLLLLIMLFVSGMCIAVAVATHVVLLPLLAIPAAFVYNLALRRLLLPYWMARKIASVV
jgi:hypothetical protein